MRERLSRDWDLVLPYACGAAGLAGAAAAYAVLEVTGQPVAATGFWASIFLAGVAPLPLAAVAIARTLSRGLERRRLLWLGPVLVPWCCSLSGLPLV